MVSECVIVSVSSLHATIADCLSVITSIHPAVVFDEPVNHVTFDPVSELEVKKVIDACPPKTLPLDFIPVSMIKDCSDIFSHLICKLANLSFAEVVFPEVFKVGEVTLLIKKIRNRHQQPSELLSCHQLELGNILERLGQKQLAKTFHNCNTFKTHCLELSVWRHFIVLQLHDSTAYTRLLIRHTITRKVATLTFKALHHHQSTYLPLPAVEHLLSNLSATVVWCWFTGEAGDIEQNLRPCICRRSSNYIESPSAESQNSSVRLMLMSDI